MIIVRSYFFVGLVATTIFFILLVIADPAHENNINVAQWALLGILVSCVPIILSLESVLLKKKWLLPSGGDDNNRLRKEFVGVVIKSLIIAIFINIFVGLIISFIYGEEVFQVLMAGHAAQIVLLVFVLATVLSLAMRCNCLSK